MKAKNINNEAMKNANLSYVLDSIRKKDTISRKDIAALCGLTSSSITNIVDKLIKDGYIKETGTGKSLGGRKPILIQINPKARFIIGVELNVSNIICIVTDFMGNKLLKKICKTNLEEGKEKVISRLIKIINDSIRESKISKSKILGIGLVSAGPYDHVKGVMINPPNFIGWSNVPIKKILEDGVGIETYFEKESVAAAIGEYWLGQGASAKSLMAINVYNIGIGGGLVINGEIYHGFMDGAGDLGHMAIDINGPTCTCGEKGCLEAIASGKAIIDEVKSRIYKGEYSKIQDYVDNIENIDINYIAKAIEAEDILCKNVIEKCANYFGIALSNIINLISPEMIVVGGEVVDKCNLYFHKAVGYIRKKNYPGYNKNIKIMLSKFGDERGVLGGIGIVLNKFNEKLAGN